MADDWIRMRVNLQRHPKVLRAAELLLTDKRYVDWAGFAFTVTGDSAPSHNGPHNGSDPLRYAALRTTRYVFVTALLRFWGYANEHAKADFIESLSMDAVDDNDVVGVPGFSAALSSIGWAKFKDGGGVILPDFKEHNTSAEVRKSTAADRQKAYRERLKQQKERDARDITENVTRDAVSHPREEKSREEKILKPTDPSGSVVAADESGGDLLGDKPAGEGLNGHVAAMPACPHSKIIDLYHELCPTLQRVRTWEGARKNHSQARWRETCKRLKFSTEEQGLAWFRTFFECVADDEFLMGKMPPKPPYTSPMSTTLPYLLDPRNFANLIERFAP